MKKRILSLIVSLAMVMTVFAGMTVPASADDTAAPAAAFTVYTQDADGALTVAKAYTAEEFEALAETGSIGGFYHKNGLNGITSSKYVTMETLLADAGLNKDFVTALYATEVKDGAVSTYTKCEYKAYLDAVGYVYGETKGSDEAFAGATTEQPLAVSVTVAKGTVAAEQTIADYMKNTKDTDTGYNVIAGSLNESDNAGKRLAQGISGVAVTVDKTAMDTAAAKALKVKSLTVKSTKAKTATVKYKKTTGADGYQITYSTSKKFTKKTNKLTKKTTYNVTKLKKGKAYYVKVRAYKTVDGKKVYGKYTTAKKVVVK